MREFMISTSVRNAYQPLVLMEDDTMGIIGSLLFLTSQLDEGEEVKIVCICQDVDMRGDE